MSSQHVLLVANRFTSNMDVLNNREYRTFQIAKSLIKLGLNVTILLIDYKSNEYYIDEINQIYSLSVKSKQFLKQYTAIKDQITSIGASYIWYTNGPIVGMIAHCMLLFNVKGKVIYEVLDNYDTYYPMYLFPIKLWDKFIRKNACLCLYVTEELAARDYSSLKSCIFFNGVDNSLFKKLSKDECRKKFKLGLDKKLIGYTGSLDERVVDNLVKLIENPQLKAYEFIIASNSKTEMLNRYDNVHFLGQQKMQDVPFVINCCDVMIIPNREDAFTKYCFPSKLLEYVSCEAKFLITPINKLNQVVGPNNISSFDMDEFAKDIVSIDKNPSPHRYKAEDFSWFNLVKKVWSCLY